MSGFGPLPADWADRYFAAIDEITANWQHLLDALRAAGAQPEMSQTGGMCMAIDWQLDDRGAYARLTTAEGPLAHERDDEPADLDDEGFNSFYVGVMLHDEDEGVGHVLHFGHPHDKSGDAAAAAEAVLRAVVMYEEQRAADDERRLMAGYAAYQSVWCHRTVPDYRVTGASVDTGVIHGPEQRP